MRPDGKELAIPSGDLGIVLWDLDPQHWLDAACSLAGRNLTPEEWDQYLGAFGEYHESCNGNVPTHSHVRRARNVALRSGFP